LGERLDDSQRKCGASDTSSGEGEPEQFVARPYRLWRNAGSLIHESSGYFGPQALPLHIAESVKML